MKMVLSVILLVAMQLSITIASPVSEKDVETVIPASEGLVQNANIKTLNGYVPTPGIGIHKYNNAEKKSWNDARNTCLNEGGHLAVIGSAIEEALIIKYINITGDYGVDQLWIGLHEQFKKDEWVSVKDERLDAIGYAHWSAGQPDGMPNEHCATITPTGMNDYVCDNKLFFVCEM